MSNEIVPGAAMQEVVNRGLTQSGLSEGALFGTSPDIDYNSKEFRDNFDQLMTGDWVIAEAKRLNVPGLVDAIYDGASTGGDGGMNPGAPAWLGMAGALGQYYEDPGKFFQNRLQTLAARYTYGTYRDYGSNYSYDQYAKEADKNLADIKSLSQYAVQNNLLNPADINSTVANGSQAAAKEMIRYSQAGKGDSFGELVAFFAPALAIALPGLGSAIGAALAPTLGVAAQAALGAGLLSGAVAEATGGDFLKGAIAGGLGSVAGSIVNPAVSNAFGGGIPGNIVANAITSGAISEATGGDFAVGALAGATSAGISGLAKEIPGFNNLDKRAQNAIVSAATSAATTGKLSETQLMKAIGSAIVSTAASGQAPSSKDFIEGYFAPGGEGYDQQLYESLGMTSDSLGETPSNQDILDAIGYTPDEATGVEPDWSGYADLDQGDLTELYAPETEVPEMVVTAPRPEPEAEGDIPEMVVTAPRPEPEAEVPEMVITAPRPEAQPTTPVATPTAPKATPTAPKATPTGGTNMQALLALLGGAQQATPAATATTTPFYSEMGPYLDIGSPLDISALEAAGKDRASTNQQQTTKIATGGYIDGLLAGDMTVDDLLDALR